MKNAYSVVALAAFLVVFTFTNAMAERVSKSFNVNGTQTLLLQNLFANVTVKVGNGNSVAVVISGDKKSIKDIFARQDDRSQISIKGKEGTNNGGSSVSINNSGGMTIITSGGGTIVVNGKVISGGEAVKPASIEVSVPRGTNIEAFQINKLSSTGVNGKLKATVSEQGELAISEVMSAKLKCSEQSVCRASKVTGNVRLVASEQSQISVSGSMLDVEADASEQSSISINGSCHDVDAQASEQSEVTGNCKINGRLRKHATEQSHISLR